MEICITDTFITQPALTIKLYYNNFVFYKNYTINQTMKVLGKSTAYEVLLVCLISRGLFGDPSQ